MLFLIKLFSGLVSAGQLRHDRVRFLAIVRYPAVSRVVAIPTRRRIQPRRIPEELTTETRAVTLSTSSHPPSCHCQRGAASSGRPSFTRNVRRTTNSLSVTSCAAPERIFFDTPIHEQRANLDRLGIVFADPHPILNGYPLAECDDMHLRSGTAETGDNKNKQTTKYAQQLAVACRIPR